MGFLDKYLTQPKPAGVRELPPNVQAATAGDPQAARYAEGALKSAADNIQFAPPGTRNHTLNAEAWSIGQLVEAGHIDGNEVLHTLWQAGLACGLPESEVASVIPRAMSQADARDVQLDPEYGPVDAPDVAWTPTPAPKPEDTPTPAPEVVGEGLSQAEKEEDAAAYAAEQKLAADIEREAYRLRILEEAKKVAAREQVAALVGQIAPPVSLADFLSVEDPPITWVMEGLQPVGTRALLAAQAKAGKTTLVSNLIKALADGGAFLGDIFNHFDGTITLIDDELDDRMLRRWLKRLQIQHPEKIRVVTLRGRLQDFNIVDDEIRRVWADMLTGTDYLILDCLRPVLDACGLDENHEAGIFLNAFDALLKQATIDNALVVHHMGHGANRSRGDSRIMDWPDALWKLKRVDPDAPESKRFFSAFGREVNIKEEALHYTDGKLMLDSAITGKEKNTTDPHEWAIKTWRLNAGSEARPKSWWQSERKIDNDVEKYAPSKHHLDDVLKTLIDRGDLVPEGTARGGATYRPNGDSEFVQYVFTEV